MFQKFCQFWNYRSENDGEFSLKNLSYFIKCTNLCSQVEIYLENDLPMVVKYDVADLGEIKLCVSSIPST
jgi:hypothetical protein